MSKPARILGIAVGTLTFLVLGLLYPALARGEAWLGAIWTVPVLAWLPREARLPTLLGLIVVIGALVIWRMTLAADARTPRLRMSTVAPLLTGPRGFRTKLRDMPGMIRVAAIALAHPRHRPAAERAARREHATRRASTSSSSSISPARCARSWTPTPRPRARRAGGVTRLTRLDTAKEVILDFVARRKNDRIGVVVFGRAAYILSPPTLDKSLLAAPRQQDGARPHRRQRHRDRRRRRHRGRAPPPLDARARRRSSSSPTATRTPARSRPTTPRTSRRRRRCASTRCRSATATTSTSRTAPTSSASRASCASTSR